jgi:hypothetical protein
MVGCWEPRYEKSKCETGTNARAEGGAVVFDQPQHLGPQI